MGDCFRNKAMTSGKGHQVCVSTLPSVYCGCHKDLLDPWNYNHLFFWLTICGINIMVPENNSLWVGTAIMKHSDSPLQL